MTAHHKPPSSDRHLSAASPASGARRGDPGAVRPGESRFDARAWRDAVQERAQGTAQGTALPSDSGAPDAKAAKRPDKVLEPAQAPAHIAAAAMKPAETGTRWRYLAVWAVLGSISAAYVAGMAWQKSSNFEIAIAPVTETLERLANDIAELKVVTSDLDSRERVTAARVVANETRLGRFAETAAPLVTQHGAQAQAMAAASAPPAAHSQRPTNRAVLADEVSAPAAAVEPQRPSRVMAGVVLATPGTPPGLVVGPAPTKPEAKPDAKPVAASKPTLPAGPVNGVRTGSLAEPVPGATPAPAAVAKRPAGLLIAWGPSLDSVKLSWNVLQQNHGAVLGPVEPRIIPAGDGSAFQLIAGPYASEADAAKACSNLRARGVTCRPAEYTGATL